MRPAGTSPLTTACTAAASLNRSPRTTRQYPCVCILLRVPVVVHRINCVTPSCSLSASLDAFEQLLSRQVLSPATPHTSSLLHSIRTHSSPRPSLLTFNPLSEVFSCRWCAHRGRHSSLGHACSVPACHLHHLRALFYTHWRNARCSYDAVYVVYFKTNARILRADCPNLVAFCIDVASSVGGEGGCSVSASLPQHHF